MVRNTNLLIFCFFYSIEELMAVNDWIGVGELGRTI